MNDLWEILAVFRSLYHEKFCLGDKNGEENSWFY